MKLSFFHNLLIALSGLIICISCSDDYVFDYSKYNGGNDICNKKIVTLKKRINKNNDAERLTIKGNYTGGLFDGINNVKTIDASGLYIESGSLPPGLFKDCQDVKTIILPSSIRGIGDYTFAYCYELRDVQISTNKDSREIKLGKACFLNCKFLDSLSFKIGDDIPEECFKGSGLTSISDIYFVGKEAFSNCESLKTVIFSSSVLGEYDNCVYISEKAFENCINLEDVSVINNNKEHDFIADIGNHAFSNCISLSNAKDLFSQWAYVKEGAFQDCKKMNLRLNIKGYLDKFAFKGSGVESVTLTIGDNVLAKEAFQDCSALKTVRIKQLGYGNIVSIIDTSAFQNCVSLTEIIIETPIECIYENAFKDCKSIKHIISDESINNIRGQAFAGCAVLDSIPNINWEHVSVPLILSAFEGCTTIRKNSYEKRRFDNVSDVCFYLADHTFSDGETSLHLVAGDTWLSLYERSNSSSSEAMSDMRLWAYDENTAVFSGKDPAFNTWTRCDVYRKGGFIEMLGIRFYER